MSASSQILAHQARQSQHLANVSGDGLSLIDQEPLKGHGRPIIPVKRVIASKNTPSYGGHVDLEVSSGVSLLGDCFAEFVLPANAAGTAQVQTITFSGTGTAWTGQTFFTYKGESSYPVLENLASAAQVQAALNAIPALAADGSVTVVLTSGTIADGDAVYTVTWDNDNLVPAAIYAFSQATETTSGVGLEVVTATTTSGVDNSYADYPGLSIIESVEVYSGSGSRLIHTYDYVTVMHSLMCTGDLSRGQTQAILNMAGGKQFEGGNTVIAPLPAFWTSVMQDGVKGAPVYLGALSRSPITFRLKLRSQTGMNASSATITSCNLVYQEFLSDPDVVAHFQKQVEDGTYEYHSYDVETNVGNTMAATPTDVNISQFRGDIKRIVALNKTTANYDTTLDRFALEKWTQARLRMDGLDVHENETSEYVIEADSYMSRGKHQHELAAVVANVPLIYNFSVLDQAHGSHVYAGSLPMANVNTLTLQASGAASSRCDIVSFSYAKYLYRDGALQKDI